MCDVILYMHMSAAYQKKDLIKFFLDQIKQF